MSLVPPVHERTALSVLGELYATHDVVPHPGRLTGVVALDEVLGNGPADGELCLVAGPPGVGKSILCTQWARHLLRAGDVVVHVCTEQSVGTLVARLMRLELRERTLAAGTEDDLVDELTARIADVASGSLNVAEVVESHPLLRETEQAISSYGSRLVFLGGGCDHPTVDDIRRTVGRLTAGSVTVVVDCVEQLRPSAGEVRGDPVESVLGDLKALAQDRSVAVVAVAAVEPGAFNSEQLELHQLNRARTAAYAADQIIGLANAGALVRARIVKHRTGASGGSVVLGRDFAHSRFTSGPTGSEHPPTW